jgi:hypothetical protein
MRGHNIDAVGNPLSRKIKVTGQVQLEQILSVSTPHLQVVRGIVQNQGRLIRSEDLPDVRRIRGIEDPDPMATLSVFPKLSFLQAAERQNFISYRTRRI